MAKVFAISQRVACVCAEGATAFRKAWELAWDLHGVPGPVVWGF